MPLQPHVAFRNMHLPPFFQIGGPFFGLVWGFLFVLYLIQLFNTAFYPFHGFVLCFVFFYFFVFV